ncbi:MAG TPA: RluA family pseudouridine synthase [Chitinophagaceae bacterium]|nr:RluA family pseudouridine synthase [Chitinophagaceae bacterium]
MTEQEEAQQQGPAVPRFKGIESIQLFEDDDCIVLNKPSGMLSIPDRTQSQPSLKDYLAEKFGSIFTVHRLDKETSGVIVFAKTDTMHKHLSLQFEDRQTKKIYNGLVTGKPARSAGIIDEPIAAHPSLNGSMAINPKGKPSTTEYSLLEAFRTYSWLQFNILTGRTHQIRVHMKHLGHPIACDPLYGDGKPVLLSSFKKKFNLAKSAEEERPIMARLALHAAQLSFTNLQQQTLQFEAPLPKDLRALLQQLRKWNPER